MVEPALHYTIFTEDYMQIASHHHDYLQFCAYSTILVYCDDINYSDNHYHDNYIAT